MYIPPKIKVGYQERIETYTGKLAYVIYYDNKNVLRKETSFEGWRDKKIKPNDYDNTPMSGFVLNKKVGDYHSGWDSRRAYIRIYDPRGFEFEITVDNLVYILEHCNCEVGKGLDGEFIYGWSGKDLVLLPTNSKEYETFKHMTELRETKSTITNTKLIIGATYLTKRDEELVYMCRADEYNYFWGSRIQRFPLDETDIKLVEQTVSHKNMYWFYNIKNKTFTTHKSINGKFAYCINENCVDDYEDIYESLSGKEQFVPIDLSNTKMKVDKIDLSHPYLTLSTGYNYIKMNDTYMRINHHYFYINNDDDYIKINDELICKKLDLLNVDKREFVVEKHNYFNSQKYNVAEIKYNYKEILEKLKVYKPVYYLKNGKKRG